jgi:hypothetical protein
MFLFAQMLRQLFRRLAVVIGCGSIALQRPGGQFALILDKSNFS